MAIEHVQFDMNLPYEMHNLENNCAVLTTIHNILGWYFDWCRWPHQSHPLEMLTHLSVY